MALLAALLLLVATQQFFNIKPALAAPANIRIVAYNARLYSQPNTGSAVLGQLQYLNQPDYLCYTTGTNVGGTNLWWQVRWNGYRAYYSADYDDSSYRVWIQRRIEPVYGIPACLNLSIAGSWPATNTTYNRNAAVAWALAHAQDVQPAYFPSCTWFVSQALWAGGFTPDSTWNSEGSHGLANVPGTATATDAQLLTDYLYNKFLSTDKWGVVNLTKGRFYNNAMSEAVPGDYIVYDWTFYQRHPNDDGSLSGFEADHVALIVDIASGNYPEVSEWGTDAPAAEILGADYLKRGWTWSVDYNTWIQNEPPDKGKFVAAKLIHFPQPQP